MFLGSPERKQQEVCQAQGYSMELSQTGARISESQPSPHLLSSAVSHLDLARRESQCQCTNEQRTTQPARSPALHEARILFPSILVSYLRCQLQTPLAAQHGTNIREADGIPGAATSIPSKWIRDWRTAATFLIFYQPVMLLITELKERHSERGKRRGL